MPDNCVWANASHRALAKAEPVVSALRASIPFAAEARTLGEILVDVKADIPEPTCSAIDFVLADIKEVRKLADKYTRDTPDDVEAFRDFASTVDTALWGTPDDLETLRHANAQLRDAVCHLGSYCHEAGRLLLKIAAQGIEAGTDETLQAAQPEGQEPGGEAMRPDTVTPSSQDTDQ